jgi:hypothetical protein
MKPLRLLALGILDALANVGEGNLRQRDVRGSEASIPRSN